MVLKYKDFGKNDIFDQKKYNLKKEYRVTRKSDFGLLQGDSVFDTEGGSHKIKVKKNDIAKCEVEFSTDGSLKINNDNLVSNTVLGIELKKEKETGSISADYTMENFRSKLALDAEKGVASLSSETIVASDGLSVGFQIKVDQTANVCDYNAAVNWEVDENSTYTAHTESKCDKLLFTCVKKVGTDSEVAGRLTYDCNQRKSELNFGAACPFFGGQSQWLLGSEAAKMLYSKKLSDNVEGEFAVNFPVSRGLAGMTHGFRLSFS